ncbi:hypothetical protein cce_1424 [Crocosphaera subtropica ATCC 51142]|uniref:Uncharacterized protein n=1 Tax=Crocosphaera subtropica (strain ATCC 51142 / BH68) TaxID=43989 RepID=B1WWQ0_CROS5|nr:hypothetical protein [Crocosphaera subtropica]ACB50774.1 hypothetical protein cce_1424 [Crocosphaera subtropica ATCC 51142]
MTVQDNVQSLISELEQILWQDKLKEYPEVSILLERIRHHLLMGQSSLENHYDIHAERLSEIILNRVDHKISDRILQGELQQLHYQRDALLQEIKTLESQKQTLLSNFVQELSTDRELSLSQIKNSQVNYLNESLETDFQPLLEDLHLYSDALQAGIERMYRLGQQSETKFLAYLNRLQEKLELFLQDEKTKNKMMIPDDWFLGFDITTHNLSGYLFTYHITDDSLEKIKCYSLSELVELCSLKLVNHESIIENVKEKLTALHHIFNDNSLKIENDISVKNIIENIKKIVLICPSRWNEKDRNLLKNLIVENFKISQFKEVICIPKPLALTLSNCSQHPSDNSVLSCVINLTETRTELSIVDLSQELSGTMTQQLFYGTQGIDQDILCYLIYPQWYDQITLTFPPVPQPLPTPGIAEISRRKILKQYLENNSLGNDLIEAAQLTRLILQEQEEFTSTLTQKSWSVNRQEMIKKVINPWIKTINEKLKIMLSQGQYSPDSITHIILAGEGINSLDHALIPWLTQRFCKAKVISAEKRVNDDQIFIGLNNLLI